MPKILSTVDFPSTQQPLDDTTAAFTTAQETKLAGIETGADVTDIDAIETIISGLFIKGAPSLSDIFPILDTDTGDELKSISYEDFRDALASFLASAVLTFTNKTLTAPVIGGTVSGTYTIGGTPTFPANVLYRFKSLTVESPTASENIAFFYTDREITITKVADVVKGTGSPSLTWNIHFDSTRNDGTPTALFSSNRATTSLSGSTTTSFANATIPAGSWVWWISSAMTTVTEFHLTLTFTQG